MQVRPVERKTYQVAYDAMFMALFRCRGQATEDFVWTVNGTTLRSDSGTVDLTSFPGGDPVVVPYDVTTALESNQIGYGGVCTLHFGLGTGIDIKYVHVSAADIAGERRENSYPAVRRPGTVHVGGDIGTTEATIGMMVGRAIDELTSLAVLSHHRVRTPPRPDPVPATIRQQEHLINGTLGIEAATRERLHQGHEGGRAWAG